MFYRNRGIHCHCPNAVDTQQSNTCSCTRQSNSNCPCTNTCSCNRPNIFGCPCTNTCDCNCQQPANCNCNRPPSCSQMCPQPPCQIMPPIPPVMPIPSVGFDGLRAYGGKYSNRFDEHGTFMSQGNFHTIALDCEEPMRKMFSEGSCLVVERAGTYLVQYDFILSLNCPATITSAILTGSGSFCKSPIQSTTLIEEFTNPNTRLFSCSSVISIKQPCTYLSLGIMSNMPCIPYTISASSAHLTAIKLD